MARTFAGACLIAVALVAAPALNAARAADEPPAEQAVPIDWQAVSGAVALRLLGDRDTAPIRFSPAAEQLLDESAGL